MKTKLWQHMAETHKITLLESEESDIRWASNEDAEKERLRLYNQITKLNSEIKKMRGIIARNALQRLCNKNVYHSR